MPFSPHLLFAAYLVCQVSILEKDKTSIERYCLPFLKRKGADLYVAEGLLDLAFKDKKLLEELEKFAKKRKENLPPHLLHAIEAAKALNAGPNWEKFKKNALAALKEGCTGSQLITYLLVFSLLYNDVDTAVKALKFAENNGVSLREDFLFEKLFPPKFAIPVLEKLVKENPKKDYYLLLAKLSEKEGKTERAEMVLKEALKRYPDDEDIKERLGRVLLKEGKVEEALNYLPKNNGELLLGMLDRTDDFKTFKGLAEILLREFPAGPNILRKILVGYLLFDYREGVLKVGKLWTDRLEKPSPEEEKILSVYLAKKICLGRKPSKRELELLKKASKNCPSAGLTLLLWEFKEKGTLKGQILQEIDPSKVVPLLRPLYGVLSLEISPKEERKILENFPADSLLRWAICLDERLAERLVKSYLRKVSSPADCTPLFEVLFKTDEYRLTAEALKGCLEKFPDRADLLNSYGYTLLQLCGKECLEEAKRYIERSLKLEPDSPFAADSLGWAYYLEGNYTAAKIWLEKALKNFPDEPVVNAHYGELLLKLGKPCEGKKYLLKALRRLEEMPVEPEKGIKEHIKNLLKEAKERCP